MRFVISGEWTRNRLLKVIVSCFLAYTFILWVTNAGMYFSKMSLRPSSVVQYYLGDEQRFLEPRTLAGMLEVLHFHSFAMGILLLTLTHLLLFVPAVGANQSVRNRSSVPLRHRRRAVGLGRTLRSSCVRVREGTLSFSPWKPFCCG
jgi:hypothetical protein